MDDFEVPYPESLTVLLAGAHAARRHPGFEPGDMLRRLRRGRKLSQREVAKRAGMRQARVSEIERSGATARWREIRTLLEAVGCVPVLLAVSASYRPLARKRIIRYTEPQCSAD